MHGLGTIVNVAAIVVGGLAGLLGGRRIPERLQKTLMSAMGVSVLFLLCHVGRDSLEIVEQREA